MIKILNDIKIPVASDENIFEICRKKAGLKKDAAAHFKILKKSVDARDKGNILFVYSVEIGDTLQAGTKAAPCVKKLPFRPVVVGSGPAGLFAAYVLASCGLKPIVFERGSEVDKRKQAVQKFWQSGSLDTNCNVQFGEGGAGTFSDGKLNTQVKSPHIQTVLETYVKYGAPQDILFLNKPHIGTDLLSAVVKNMREGIIAMGGEFKFDTLVKDIITEGGTVRGIAADKYYESQAVVLAAGHSARDTFKMLYYKGLNMSQKAFSAGLRIEHLQSMVDVSQYGKFAGNKKLGAADYKLFSHLGGGRTVYTFCMCPGGYVVSGASEEGMVATNGMSEHARNGINANSALLVSVTPEDFNSSHPLAGIEFQRELERKAYIAGGGGYKAPCCTVSDFLSGKVSQNFSGVLPTYKPGVVKYPLFELLPGFMAQGIREGIIAFDKKLKGFSDGGAVLTGIESRSSSPVRIERDISCQSVNVKGLYPCGEGAGYAGGIVSAAVDGIRAAEGIINSI